MPNKRAKKSGGANALCWAASQGNLAEIKRLVANGFDLNDADYDLRTPIHLAASEGQNEVIEYFVAKRVNLNPKDRWGGTPLADADREGHKDTVALLKKHGVK